MEQETNKIVRRQRSPNYPYYSLRECVTFLNKLYSKYGKRDTSIEEAVIQMGHSPTSSTAPRVIASMRSYGLLNSGGGKDSKLIHVTTLGQAIALEVDGSNAWYSSLREAALSDASTKTLYSLWGASLPSEGGIKIKLEKDMDYSPDGAKRFASVITDNFVFAQVSEYFNGKAEDMEDTDGESGDGRQNDESRPSSQIRKANLLLPGIGREIVIYAPTDLVDKEFELIFKWLELQKYGLVSTPVKKESTYEKKEQEPDIPF